MKANEEFIFKPKAQKARQGFPDIETTPANSIAVYTVLTLLLRMKNQLGLEAMLEYLENYLDTIGHYNPKLAEAVARALSMMNVERIYKGAMCEDENRK